MYTFDQVDTILKLFLAGIVLVLFETSLFDWWLNRKDKK